MEEEGEESVFLHFRFFFSTVIFSFFEIVYEEGEGVHVAR